MDAGAFSDDTVAQVAAQFICVAVDADRDEDNKVFGQYGVSGMPTLIFLDPSGKNLGKMGKRDAASVAKQMQEILGNLKVEIPWKDDLAASLDAAKNDGKPILVLFVDDKKDSQKMLESFTDLALAPCLDQCVYVKAPFEKDSDMAKLYKVTSAPALRIIDPGAENPQDKPLASMNGKQSPKQIKGAIEKAAKSVKKPEKPKSK